MKSWAIAGTALLLAAAVAFGSLSAPRAARATPLIVNSTDDAPDAVPGDGICATLTGVCTLRAAIMEANMLPDFHTITLPAGTYVLTIPGAGEDSGATGDLDVLRDLSIVGAGAATTIIDGGGIDRVFDVFAPAVQLSGVTIQNGSVQNPNVARDASGGGIRSSAAIRTDNGIFILSPRAL